MVRICGDTGLNKGVEHLPMGCESKLRVVGVFPLVFVDNRWGLAERGPPFATTGYREIMSQRLAHDGNVLTFVDFPKDINQVHGELSVVPFDANTVLIRIQGVHGKRLNGARH